MVGIELREAGAEDETALRSFLAEEGLPSDDILVPLTQY